jgi:isopenicillin N synthase-like dioxygenase
MEEQRKVAKELHAACSEVGFVYIRGHGCPQDVINGAFEQMKALFDLSTEDKMKLDAKNSPLYRGYNSAETGAHSCTPTATDTDMIDTFPDLKESFTIGAEGSSSPMHGMNQFPESLEQFEIVMREYWNMLLHVVGPRLMKALAMSLELPIDFFVDRCSDPVAQMVLLRYPSTTNLRHRRGCGSHTDCGFITMLSQDESGLEVQRADGTWVLAPPIPGTFVVNLGDMAARWSNDVYKSTLHRVLHATNTRHSIPFFLNSNFDAMVECIARDQDEEPKYPPVKAGEYILEKLGLMYLSESHSTKQQ